MTVVRFPHRLSAVQRLAALSLVPVLCFPLPPFLRHEQQARGYHGCWSERDLRHPRLPHLLPRSCSIQRRVVCIVVLYVHYWCILGFLFTDRSQASTAAARKVHVRLAFDSACLAFWKSRVDQPSHLVFLGRLSDVLTGAPFCIDIVLVVRLGRRYRPQATVRVHMPWLSQCVLCTAVTVSHSYLILLLRTI